MNPNLCRVCRSDL